MKEKIVLKIGDMVWVDVVGSSQNYGYGEVKSVWFEEEEKQYFEFWCEINGGLRLGETDKLIEKPTARMMSKLASASKELSDVLKAKQR